MPLTNEEIKLELAQAYRGFRTSNALDEDMKSLKKINIIFGKMEKTDRDSYAQEIIAVLKMLNNRLDLGKVRLLVYEIVDIKFHTAVDLIIDSMELE